MENQLGTLGSRLKELRKKNSLTLQDVSEKIDRLKTTISNWENSKSIPDANDLIKLSELYNSSVDMILTGKESGDKDFQQYKVITEQALNKLKDAELDHETGKVDALLKELNIDKNISIIKLLYILLTYVAGEHEKGNKLIESSNYETYNLLKELYLELTESFIKKTKTIEGGE